MTHLVKVDHKVTSTIYIPSSNSSDPDLVPASATVSQGMPHASGKQVAMMRASHKVIYVSVALMILYMAFSSTQGMISQIFNQLGYKDLGGIALITLYIVQAFSNLFVPILLRRISLRSAFCLSASGFIPFIAVGILPRICFENKEADSSYQSVFCSEIVIYSTIIFCSALNGLSASCIWICQGRYIGMLSTASSPLFGVFCCVFAFQQLLGSLISVFALQLAGQRQFFVAMTIVGLISVVMFSFTPSAHDTHVQDIDDDVMHSPPALPNTINGSSKSFGLSITTSSQPSIRDAFSGMKQQYKKILSSEQFFPLTIVLGLFGVFLCFNIGLLYSLIEQTASTSASFTDVNTKTCYVYLCQGFFSLVGGYIGTMMASRGYSLYKYTTLGIILIQLAIIIALYQTYTLYYSIIFIVGALVGLGDYFFSSFFNEILTKLFNACPEIYAYKSFLNSFLFLAFKLILNALEHHSKHYKQIFLLLIILYISLSIHASQFLHSSKESDTEPNLSNSQEKKKLMRSHDDVLDRLANPEEEQYKKSS